MKNSKMRSFVVVSVMGMFMAALMALNAYDDIYLLKNGTEYPDAGKVFGIIMLLFIVFIIAAAFTARKYKTDTPPENNFSWLGFLGGYLGTAGFRWLRSHSSYLVESARNNIATVNINKVAADIITLHISGFIAAWVMFFVIEYISRKKNK